MFRLGPSWRQVAARAWSVRFIFAAVVLTGLDAALPLFGGVLPLPRWGFALLTGAICGAAIWARLLAQRNLKG